MTILVCVDDTDSLTKEISTGKIADYIKEAIEESDLGRCSDITRHQLLLHKDIPYTSHNSSMCMEVETGEDSAARIISLGVRVLVKYMDKTSSPGFCCCLGDALSGDLRGDLVAFGRRAQKEVLTKEDAYKFAARAGVHLSEHGGGGQGVIGALAGVGLRLGGNDGRYRGKIKIASGRADGFASVEEIRAQSGAVEVRDMNGAVLERGALVYVNKYAKAVLADHKKVVLVSRREDGSYMTCSKEELEGGWEN